MPFFLFTGIIAVSFIIPLLFISLLRFLRLVPSHVMVTPTIPSEWKRPFLSALLLFSLSTCLIIVERLSIRNPAAMGLDEAGWWLASPIHAFYSITSVCLSYSLLKQSRYKVIPLSLLGVSILCLPVIAPYSHIGQALQVLAAKCGATQEHLATSIF